MSYLSEMYTSKYIENFTHWNFKKICNWSLLVIKMNDNALSVVYLILVLVLLLPGFIYANKNKKEFFNNFFIWMFIIGIILLTDINIEYLKIGYDDPKTYSIKPISISNNQDGNVLEAIDLIDNKVKTFLINWIIEVNELNLISSSNKGKINSIEVKFKYKNENFSNKLDKDNTFFKDGLCIYTFRDFNVALEFFFEHFQEIQIVSPNKLKFESSSEAFGFLAYTERVYVVFGSNL